MWNAFDALIWRSEPQSSSLMGRASLAMASSVAICSEVMLEHLSAMSTDAASSVAVAMLAAFHLGLIGRGLNQCVMVAVLHEVQHFAPTVGFEHTVARSVDCLYLMQDVKPFSVLQFTVSRLAIVDIDDQHAVVTAASEARACIVVPRYIIPAGRNGGHVARIKVREFGSVCGHGHALTVAPWRCTHPRTADGQRQDLWHGRHRRYRGQERGMPLASWRRDCQPVRV